MIIEIYLQYTEKYSTKMACFYHMPYWIILQKQ